MILVLVTLVYSPTFRAGFVWDDDAHLTRPALRTWDGLLQIWTNPGATQQFYPLLHSLFWLEHRLWGEAAFGYHLANLFLHASVAILFARVLRQLAIPGALLAATLFALHPVQVESVAWISEQKNTLSTGFYLAATLAYLRFDRERDHRAYWFAVLFFVFGLLVKTVVASLPAALLVALWWQRGRLSLRRDALPLLPWFALGIGAGLFTAWIERTLIGAEGAAFDLTFAQRGIIAGRALWFYLGKLIWPEGLTFFYPRWKIDPGVASQWLPLLAALFLTIALWRVRGRTRAPLAAALFFAGSLFPVLGFLNVYPFLYSFVADHFQYLPSLGVFAIAAAGMVFLFEQSRASAVVATTAILGAFAFQSWQLSDDYRDRTTLFRATLERNPESWVACNNLGKELLPDKSQWPRAIVLFERALVLRPDYVEAKINLGLVLTQSGRPRDAIPHLQSAIRLQPNAAQAHNNLGIAFATTGQAEKALPEFSAAARLSPNVPNIHENWAKALLLLGRSAEAQTHFEQATQLRTNAKSLNPSPEKLR